MRKILNFSERAFTVISLLHYTGGPLIVILSGGASEGDTSAGTPDYALVQVLFFINYAISFFLLVLRWKKVIQVIRKDRYITVLLGLCFISFLWSTAPTVTLVRSVAIIGTSLFGVYLATRYSLKEQLQLLTWTFGIAIILSLLFIFGLPKYGIMSGFHVGKWRGIYAHKNVLGKLMIVSSIIFLLTSLNENKNRFLLWGGFVFSIILLLLSKSSSSLINFIIIMMAFFVLRTFRWRYALLFPVLSLLTIVAELSYLWLVANTEALLSSMGKDTSLTGRGPLWSAVLDSIWQHPWLGYGFSGFWKGWDTPSAAVWRVVGWEPPNGHNGLLDIWLDLGLLGLTIFLIGFLVNVVKGLAWIRMSKTAEGFWPVMYIIYFWLSNQTESALLRQNEIYWLLYVTVVISMLIPPGKSIKSVNE
jgi:exopolysaccharide production protein ExoQ